MTNKQYANKLIKQYGSQEKTDLERLKELDKMVKRPAIIFGYVFGSISTLILGFGMCVAMEEILKGYMWLGIGVGVIGIGLCLLTYPIYKRILSSRKKKYCENILNLSNKLLNE